MKKDIHEQTEFIEIVGASEHNLRCVNLRIPKHRLVVFSGVSGSGKSSLAFDTIYAEGRRRYVESLSAYARQFLGQMDKPRYDRITGLAPTIAIEQKKATSNPRSTVGTITEIHDYLRVLYARIGDQHCHKCGRPAGKLSTQEIIDALAAKQSGKAITILAPLAANRKGEFKDILASLTAQGFTRVHLNGTITRIDEAKVDPKKKNTIELVVDRLTVSSEDITRLTDSVETALRVGEKWMRVMTSDNIETYSTERACAWCGVGLPEPSPQLFSFNNPAGMCPLCEGLGRRMEVDPEKVVPDPSLSIAEGAVSMWRSILASGGPGANMIFAIAESLSIDMKKPWKELKENQKKVILYGSQDRIAVKMPTKRGMRVEKIDFEGVIPRIERLFNDTSSDDSRYFYMRYMTDKPCPECEGARLRPEARAFRVGGKPLSDIERYTVQRCFDFFTNLKLEGGKALVGTEVIKEIRNRLKFLLNVGLNYISLDRTAATLSGGESQRIRLASQLGSELSGVVYVLDEPSIGLHPRDNHRLLSTLVNLRDLGNTVLVVEHDRETIESADWVVEFGPGAGVHGGEAVFTGTVEELKESKTLTGEYLTGTREIPMPATRRQPNGKFIRLSKCTHNNLKCIDAAFPIGLFTAVTGVSGAGKSSLVNGTLMPVLSMHLDKEGVPAKYARGVSGVEHIDKLIAIDQDPIGRTPRSNAATYTKLLDHIRTVFANSTDAKVRGYGPGRFSFNAREGRCEACSGNGYVKVEMHFLADVYVPCSVCKGKRFNRETLTVRHKGLNIAEVLDLTVEEAATHFSVYRAISRILSTLMHVGLGYLKLGQPSTTLSGGEAQRIKLSRELARPSTGRTLYVLDEPTTGLHFENIRLLIEVLQELVNRGNTVVVIEHNLDVIKCADWIIDLGPDGGDAGGWVIASGSPEEVAEVDASHTGRFLRAVLNTASVTQPFLLDKSAFMR